MTLPGFVLAYHGCDEAVGENILAGKDHVRVSENDYDWLGPGAYFWENSPSRALQWAEYLRARPTSVKGAKKPFALGAIIDPGLCLDLTEASDLAVFKESYNRLVIALEKIGEPLPANEPARKGDMDLGKRRLDCLVATVLHGLREEKGSQPLDTLRAAFFEGEPLYPGTKIAAKTHIQWCVRNPRRSIRGYFRPLEQWDDQPSTFSGTAGRTGRASTSNKGSIPAG